MFNQTDKPEKKKKKTQNLISGVKLPDFAVCVLTNILLYI